MLIMAVKRKRKVFIHGRIDCFRGWGEVFGKIGVITMDWEKLFENGNEIGNMGLAEDVKADISLNQPEDYENDLDRYIDDAMRKASETLHPSSSTPMKNSGCNADASPSGNDSPGNSALKKDREAYLEGGAYAVHNKLSLNPSPTRDDLVRIMELYHHGTREEQDQAQTEMLGVLDPYILNIIYTRYSTYARKHLNDLMQQGYLGVIVGMKTYDPHLGTPTTWFSRYINHEIQDYICTQINHTTQHYSNASKKVMDCIKRKQINNIPFTEKDIYIETSVPLKTIRMCLQISNLSTVPIDSEETPIELPSNFDDPGEYVVEKMENEHIADLLFGSQDGKYISVLSEDERDCIALHYGFDGRGVRSYSEIEKTTGIPRHKIGKIIQVGLKKIKFELTKEKYGIRRERVQPAPEREMDRARHKNKNKRKEMILDNILSDAEMEFTQMTLWEYFKDGLLD